LVFLTQSLKGPDLGRARVSRMNASASELENSLARLLAVPIEGPLNEGAPLFASESLPLPVSRFSFCFLFVFLERGNLKIIQALVPKSTRACSFSFSF
jgi:hypothetical protein